MNRLEAVQLSLEKLSLLDQLFRDARLQLQGLLEVVDVSATQVGLRLLVDLFRRELLSERAELSWRQFLLQRKVLQSQLGLSK